MLCHFRFICRLHPNAEKAKQIFEVLLNKFGPFQRFLGSVENGNSLCVGMGRGAEEVGAKEYINRER